MGLMVGVVVVVAPREFVAVGGFGAPYGPQDG